VAYDRSQQGHRVASSAPDAVQRRDWRLEVGHADVPVGEPRGFAVLDPRRAGTLRAWTALLIPARGGRPSAADVGAAEYVDATVSRARSLLGPLLRATDRLDDEAVRRHHAPFVQLDGAAQLELLRLVEAQDGDVFGMVLAFTYEAYYAHPAVLTALERETGWHGLVPVFGSPMEPLDQRLLDHVRSLPPHYRMAGT